MPGFVHDDVWCLLNVDPAVEALRLFVGGDGRGDGDPAFKILVQQAYVTSNMDEFRRPAKLRERLTETEGPVRRPGSQLVLAFAENLAVREQARCLHSTCASPFKDSSLACHQDMAMFCLG